MSPPPTACCLNCDAALTAGQSFCGSCGQKATSHRLTMHEIGHDLLHAFVHVDRSIVSLVRQLAARPGSVARDYVQGRRARYFGPFAFLVIVVGLATGLMTLAGFRSVIDLSDRGAVVTDFLQRHLNLVILLQVPLLAAVCGLFFPKAEANFAERLVLVAYTSSLRALVSTLVLLPIWYFLRASDRATAWIAIPFVIVWLVYFGVAAAQFYPGDRRVLFAKGVLAAALSQALIQVILPSALGQLLVATGMLH